MTDVQGSAHSRHGKSRSNSGAARRGRLEVFTGYRVQHSVARGPAKGGIRFAPDVTPGRSARAGLVDDLEVRRGQYSVRRRQGRRHLRSQCAFQAELEKLTRRYTAEIIDFIGPERDVPAPDVNTNEQTMAWIMDTYSMHPRHTVTAVVTGKPMALGGSRGRPEATGRGCMMVTLKALAQLGMQPETARVVIQGFGNVGGMAAKLMSAAGFKIVAIMEYDGAVYNPHGLDIAALQKHRKETGSITGFAGGEDMDTQRGHVPGVRRADSGRDRERDPLRQRRPDALQDSLRGRQRPHNAAGRRDAGREEGFRDSRHSGQRRRRHGLILRMGAGPPGLLLERALVNERLEEIMVESFDAVVEFAEKHA